VKEKRGADEIYAMGAKADYSQRQKAYMQNWRKLERTERERFGGVLKIQVISEGARFKTVSLGKEGKGLGQGKHGGRALRNNDSLLRGGLKGKKRGAIWGGSVSA